MGFYYGHPRNQFWRLLAFLTGETVPGDLTEKKNLLTAHHIALYDVLSFCSIEGSRDQSIQDTVLSDLSWLSEHRIEKIFLNGKTAYRLFQRSQSREGILLPSSSAAYATLSFEEKCVLWKRELEDYL